MALVAPRLDEQIRGVHLVEPASPSISSSAPSLRGGVDPSPQARKDRSIETWRGVAIVLMVSGHVIGQTQSSGMRVDDDSLFRFFYFSTALFRMPLFTVLSGFVYALRPVKTGAGGEFLLGKLRRIGLPLLAVSTLQFLARAAVEGTNKEVALADMWRIYVYGFDQFWFLQAILLVFLAIAFIDGFGLMKSRAAWLGWLIAAIVANQFGPRSEFLSFSSALYLLPYFVLGCGLRRFVAWTDQPSVVFTAGAMFLAGIIAQQLVWWGLSELRTDRFAPLALWVGLSGTLIAIKSRWTSQWLAALGQFAFSIYLFHVFATAGSRILFVRLGLTNRELLGAIGLASGLAFPILIDLSVRRIPYLRTILLGIRNPAKERDSTSTRGLERDPVGSGAFRGGLTRTDIPAERQNAQAT